MNSTGSPPQADTTSTTASSANGTRRLLANKIVSNAGYWRSYRTLGVGYAHQRSDLADFIVWSWQLGPVFLDFGPMTSTTTPRGTTSLPAPATPQVDSHVVAAGRPVAPVERLRIMAPGEWEDFVLEWADTQRNRYVRVERQGSSGDMGRDIIGLVDVSGSVWDNYQCKHYAAGLTPTDIWLELGKLVFHTFERNYTMPRSYTFVAPHGAGTKLSNLLRNPRALKAGLVGNWDAYCKAHITSIRDIELSGPLLDHLDAIDFSIFDALPPLTLIAQHRTGPYHVARFGGGLPSRPAVEPPPTSVQAEETPYVGALFAAYGDHVKSPVHSRTDLEGFTDLLEHFNDSRFEFYSAEALRAFSRDHLPDGEYDALKDSVHHGIKNELRSEHADGFRRLMAVVSRSQTLPLNAHPLASVLSIRDRGGICHQLANDRLVVWVKP